MIVNAFNRKPDTLGSGLRYNLSDSHRGRLQWIFPLFLMLFLIIILRLIQIYVLPGENLIEELKSRIGSKLVEEPRGRIYDRNSKVLASDVLSVSIYVDPRKVTDENRMDLIDHLQQYLGLSEEEVLPCLEKKSKTNEVRMLYPVKRWLGDVPKSKLDEIVGFGTDILHYKMEPVRNYPQNDSASHLLGFVTRAGQASEGVELAYDKYLRSKPGIIQARKDNRRRLLPSSLVKYDAPTGGDMVQLTLDINIQKSLEGSLDRRMEEVGAKTGMGIIMDPYTGAILALATRPAFDPNQYSTSTPDLRKNKATLNFFEPGSAFKIVTAAAALEHGLVTPDTMIDCEGGAFNPYGHRIKDFYKLGVIPFWKVFEKSSNIGTIKVAAMLGPERLESWIRLFGFGERTSPDFQFESRGLFRPKEQWSALSMGSLPMGQEIAVTMPQLAKAFAVIANGGFVVQPYFVERVLDQDKVPIYEYQPPPAKRILSEKTALTMQDLCHKVVTHGTGKAANIPQYRAGGKTGTAQMAYEKGKGRGFDPNRYTAVFAGFAPLARPRVVAVIVIQEPTKERYGGGVCGPVFAEVVKDALIRLNVPEDPVVDPEKPHEEESSPLLSKMMRASEEQIMLSEPLPYVEAEENNDVDTIGDRPSPEELDNNLGALITPLDGLELLALRITDSTSGQALPNLAGMSKSQARECLQRLGVIMDAQGAGWVITQNPAPGTIMVEGAVCALRFGDKMTGDIANDTG